MTYASGGDIYAVDPVTGRSTPIIRGPGDLNPRWSGDGTRLVFERQEVASGPGLLFVTGADGSDPIQVTPQPLISIDTYSFSPNGKEILISATSARGIPGVFIAEADGSRIRQLDLPGPATDAAWRPPDGSEILFMCNGSDSNCSDTGIYSVNALDGKVRTILPSADTAGRFRGNPAWSPDGSMISFGEWMGINGIDVQTHIITANGGDDRTLPIPADAEWQAPINWSNDGTRLLAIRGYTGDSAQARPVIVPVHGSGPGVEIPNPGGMGTPSTSAWAWSPDDSSILGTPTDLSGTTMLDQVILDPVTGTSRTLPWTSVSQPSWQRVAP